MTKSKKPRTSNPELSAIMRRGAIHALALIACIAVLGACYWRMRKYVETQVIVPDRPPKAVLKDRPVWMSDALYTQIIRSLQPNTIHSAFDQQLLIDTTAILSRNPWIKQVREIRRVYGNAPGDTIQIDCEFRAPIALVHWKDYFWLVDGDSIKLPEQFTAQQLPSIVRGLDGRLNIRVVEGVAEAPVESGRTWAGKDLAAALDMVKLLFGQSWAEEILKIDVSNFGGAIDPKEAQIALITRYNTVVRWGRPINAEDFFVEVPTALKLQHLEQIFAQYRRIDAGQPWIDIRFDKITYPSGNVSARTDATR